MLVSVSRRDFLGSLAGSGLALGMSGPNAGDRLARKFTMDLVCGNLGVRVKLPEAIGLAHRFGFESVAPDAGFLDSITR